MVEEWRAVPGWEGLYEVSDQGRVRSLDRIVVQQARFGMIERFAPGRIMAIGKDAKGYRQCRLFNAGVSRHFHVHVLVLMAFVGPRPDGWVGDHINGVCDDNRPENLRWVSYRDNARNRFAPRGENPHVGIDFVPSRNQWRARATDASGRRRHLGHYANAETAAAAYRQFRKANP
jgi:hypothetical protein